MQQCRRGRVDPQRVADALSPDCCLSVERSTGTTHSRLKSRVHKSRSTQLVLAAKNAADRTRAESRRKRAPNVGCACARARGPPAGVDLWGALAWCKERGAGSMCSSNLGAVTSVYEA
jgi:hypothetical protein